MYKIPHFDNIPCDNAFFGSKIDHSFREYGFAAVTQYDHFNLSGNRTIGQVKEELYPKICEFMEQEEDQKRLFSPEHARGQRGYVPMGKEQQLKDQLTQWWEYFMIGQALPSGFKKEADRHPLERYRPLFYLPNKHLTYEKENPLITLGEEMVSLLEEVVLTALEKIAQARGEWFGQYASKIAWGDHVLRLNYFTAIAEKDIVRASLVGNITTLTGEKVNDIPTIDIRTKGGIVRNVTRIGPHPCADFLTLLLDSEKCNIYYLNEQNQIVPFKIEEGQIIFKTGEFADYEIAEYRSRQHGVGISKEDANSSHILLSFYAHARPLARIGQSTEGLLLNERLSTIGHQTQGLALVRNKTIRDLPSDEQMVKDLIEWEKVHGVEKLSRYFRLGENREINKRE